MKFEYYNPNPKQRYTRDGKPMKWHKGDCHVRCVAKALDISWKDAIKLEYEKALERCDAVGSTNNIEEVLLDNGFQKGVIMACFSIFAYDLDIRFMVCHGTLPFLLL